MDTLRSLYAPDAVHVAAGDNPLAGEYRSTAFLATTASSSEPVTARSAPSATVSVEGDDKVVAIHA